MIVNNSNRDGRFISSLEKLRDQENRGALAALRRGLGKRPGTELAMAPYVEWIKPEPWERPRYYLIAALFGCLPGPKSEGKPDHKLMKDRPNIGDAMDGIVGVYAGEDKSGEPEDVRREKARKRVERRFTALLNAHPDDLPRQLMRVVSLAKSKEVPVDYRRLLRDLRYWESDTKWVQMQWAASFWSGSAPPEPEDVLAEDEEERDDE